MQTIALVIHGERSDCEFEALDFECLAVERVIFQNIEKLESKCIFELPGVKEVFLSSGISAVSEDEFTQRFASSIPKLEWIHILDAAENKLNFFSSDGMLFYRDGMRNVLI